MRPTTESTSRRFPVYAALLLATAAMFTVSPASAQAPAAAVEPSREEVMAGSARERAREAALLGITAFQPTLNARDASAPNYANYDEAKANPYPLPPVLVMSDGAPVTTADQWRTARRPEIAALFDREVYGRVPNNAPMISWRVTETVNETIGGVPVVTKKLIGEADNAAAPGIVVEILMNLTTPAATRGQRVPVVMSIGSVNPRPRPPGAPPMATPPGPDYREQLLAKGWGFATLDSNSVQADNGWGLDKGVIGLANRGQPRKLDDWGVLRAWAWGASRGLDYLESDDDIDAKRVAIMGHSRTGKAAVVALAYDTRFSTGYISSSGAGGVNLYRRNFGEGVANLVAENEYHWFAGNFLKYGAVGHTAQELPVDSHMLVAMVAPRPMFQGAGVLITSPPSAFPGDAWVDAQGMFKAAAGATPVYRLLGKTGQQTDKFPPILTYLGEGELGFRQHNEGHTPAPNWPYFIRFASKYW